MIQNKETGCNRSPGLIPAVKCWQRIFIPALGGGILSVKEFVQIKGAKYCTLVGGAHMAPAGIILLFAPHLPA